ncbi:MAG: hypothetical protein Q4C60_02555 [Eubacteriales bacterium]|nr:hypothetical protein [Eubacteriales bacterium]
MQSSAVWRAGKWISGAEWCGLPGNVPAARAVRYVGKCVGCGKRCGVSGNALSTGARSDLPV